MSEGVRPSKRSRKPTNAAEENRDKQGEPSARSTEGGAPAARHSKRLKTASRAGADQPLTGAGDTDMGQLSEDLQSPVSGNTQSAKYVGPNNSIKRDEYVRLLTQALSAMGYGESAAMLEEESGIPLHSVAVTEFRNGILAGNWDDVASFLDHVDLNEAHRQEAIFLVLRQQFLELLEKGDHKGALQCVRKRSNSFGKEQRLRVHELVSLALCTRTDELYERANWAGSHSNSRYELLNTMQDFMPASVMLPERRLETLLERVLSEQQTRCSWVPLSYFSLLSDGQDGTEQIPTETAIVLEEHTDEVWHVQFSHNGKFVASASKDHTAIIWEIVSPVDVRMKHRLQEHTEPLSFVAWSPDDSLLLTCSNDTSVKLWDTHTGVCKRTYSRHVEFVTSCAWLPDGERFVTGGMDKNMYMWNTKGEELECWEGSRINDLAISDDGAFLICLSADKKIRKYCFRTKKEDVIEEKESCTSLCLSQDSQHLLVNIASQEIHLWDLARFASSAAPSFTYSGQKQGRYVIRSCFGGFNEAFVVSGSEDCQIYIWHRTTGRLLAKLSGHSGTVNSVGWNSKHSRMFASASDDHTVRIWVGKVDWDQLQGPMNGAALSNGDSNGTGRVQANSNGLHKKTE